jgi:hypothetical protein
VVLLEAHVPMGCVTWFIASQFLEREDVRIRALDIEAPIPTDRGVRPSVHEVLLGQGHGPVEEIEHGTTLVLDARGKATLLGTLERLMPPREDSTHGTVERSVNTDGQRGQVLSRIDGEGPEPREVYEHAG